MSGSVAEEEARPAVGLAAGRGTRGQELAAQGRVDRRHEVGQRHLRQRRALNVVESDHVERDVDPAFDRVRMRVDRRLVERVDLGRLGLAAGATDLVRHRFERGPRAARETHARALARERLRDGAADGLE